MSFGDYWEKKILDHLFGKSAYSAPTIYVALSTADPGDDGSTIAEPSGNGYARVSTAASDWNATTLGVGALTNVNVITFPTASGSWGTIAYVALFDAASSGNFLGSGVLDSPESVSTNQAARFPADYLTVSLG